MSTPFVGQICFFSFNWAPYGFFSCDGSLQSVQQYTALFSLLGKTYGGDGKTSFGLPDLRGRVGVGLGTAPGGVRNWPLNTPYGTEQVTITSPNQLPYHQHNLMIAAVASNTGTAAAGAMLAGVMPNQFWAAPPASANTTLNPVALASAYAAAPAPHENRQPYLVLNPCIAWDGEYPDLNN